MQCCGQLLARVALMISYNWTPLPGRHFGLHRVHLALEVSSIIPDYQLLNQATLLPNLIIHVHKLKGNLCK
ncbi:hypothetical protein CsSME_00018284 [Camellia sinensis var. sinensis]